MKKVIKSSALLLIAQSCLSFMPGPFLGPAAQAQVAGGNQAIYNDEKDLIRMDQSMIQEYQSEEQAAKSELAQQENKNQTYRLYAEKRIQDLEKAKKAGTPVKTGNSDKELQVLESWLKRDDAYRAKQQAYIAQLDQAIANLRQGQTATVANLGNDINSMRESLQDARDQQRFNNQMTMNMYNELKSEMGAAAWGDCPRDGTYNSVGGYGFMGGYGYSPMGGRRWLGGGGGW